MGVALPRLCWVQGWETLQRRYRGRVSIHIVPCDEWGHITLWPRRCWCQFEVTWENGIPIIEHNRRC